MTTLINQATLTLFTMGDRVLQKELFDLYFQQAQFYVDQLQDAVDAQSQDNWQNTMHALRGAAQSLGLEQIATLVHKLEKCKPSQARLDLVQEVLDKTRIAVVQLS